ncbi:hypothetical protein [Alkalicoccus luteus]|nr:hypothetical protein [Alkalicoccus luteus]
MPDRFFMRRAEALSVRGFLWYARMDKDEASRRGADTAWQK